MASNYFDAFDSWDSENFSSGVLLLACRLFPEFQRRLLFRIHDALPPSERGCRAVVRRLAESPAIPERERPFSGLGEAGRFDLLFRNEADAVVIENKLGAPLTRQQVAKYRRQLARTHGARWVLCTLSRNGVPAFGQHASIRWPEISQLFAATRADLGSSNRTLLETFSEYARAVSMSFSGFDPKKGEYGKYEQRELLLRYVLDKISRDHGTLTAGKYRDDEGRWFYQSTEFTDLRGVRGRYLGFYDYEDPPETVLALWPSDEAAKPLLRISFETLAKDLAAGSPRLQRALDKLVAHLDAKLRSGPRRRRA